MSETPDGNILDLILEDLRFYRELNLTVKEIRLGELAYCAILREARVCQEFTPTHCEKLLGLPLKRLTGQNPWQRDYLIAESHVQVPKRPNSNNA
jgi:hypothetical protein